MGDTAGTEEGECELLEDLCWNGNRVRSFCSDAEGDVDVDVDAAFNATFLLVTFLLLLRLRSGLDSARLATSVKDDDGAGSDLWSSRSEESLDELLASSA